MRIAGMELGWLHARGGNLRRAEALFGQVLADLDSSACGAVTSDVEWIRRWTLEGLVEVLVSAGRYREAVRRGEEALRMAEDLGHPIPIVATMYRLASAHTGLGDLDRAVDLCTRGLVVGREREVANVIQPAATRLGEAHTLAGRAEEAIASLEEAAAAGESIQGLDAFTLIALGNAHLSAGRAEEASRYARDALAMSLKARPSAEAAALHLLGEIAAQRNPPAAEEATQYFGRALALAQALGMRPLVAHCHFGLSQLCYRTGDHLKAEENLGIATAMYREMDMRLWLAKAEAAALGPPGGKVP
jgi:tetratricopeptide (TPR) repeat protein